MKLNILNQQQPLGFLFWYWPRSATQFGCLYLGFKPGLKINIGKLPSRLQEVGEFGRSLFGSILEYLGTYSPIYEFLLLQNIETSYNKRTVVLMTISTYFR